VLDADGTLLIGPYRSGGSALTAKLAKEMGKPLSSYRVCRGCHHFP